MIDPGISVPGRPPPTEGEMLLRYLEGRDVPCPACRYNVRDLRSDRCPECGEQLELALRLSEPKQAALIAGLIGLSAGLGLGGLLLIYGVIVIYARYTGGLDEFFIINGTGFAIHATALFFWLKYWRRLRLATAWVRRVLAVVCWAMALAEVIVLATCLH